ncbi:hypothetical protein AJ79_05630 [Helicocarpus griseus UAMH5409]|uniref:Glycosyl transferase family 1 domain-containing protein n=1 Tax=Helicocarpus griseus UAMH5409 TaxID=1447875 RepID=A0A2B7XDD5_9EURO|nr:hypothetical protein AJ79_05630 [Helicocarpus griseus UAMH5409]
MPQILDVEIVGWNGMRTNWWQWSRPPSTAVPRNVAACLKKLSKESLNLIESRPISRKPSSFGVYLGDFSDPPTEIQTRLLSQWDLVILDPLRTVVADAVVRVDGCRALGRVEIGGIISKADSTQRGIEKLVDMLISSFHRTSFSGVLLAGWEKKFTPVVLSEVFRAVRSTGLSVYLETGAPYFLTEPKALRSESVSGLVVRNATVLRNGEKRDYFQMMSLQPTVKAFVSESCMRDFVVMAWETVDDIESLTNAVARRSIQWCGFYSAIAWIGSEICLTDATLNSPTIEPLSAFGWLKEDEVLKVHDIWRSLSEVAHSRIHTTAWESLKPIFSELDEILQSKGSEPLETGPADIRLSDPPDWISQIGTTENPLSVSPSGMDYSYLGCFPLGFDASPIAFAEVLQSQTRLKGLGLLHPVEPAKLQNMGNRLQNFYDSYLLSNWTHAPEVISAVKELSVAASNNMVRVYLGLDSGFCKDDENRFWTVYQQGPDGLDIYVSKKLQGLVGTVLHTFLSSKGFPRHVCFELETAFSHWSNDLVQPAGIPRRLMQDLQNLTPEEKLLLLQHLTFTDAKQALVGILCNCLKKELLDAPSLEQLKGLNTVGYLSGRVSSESLVKSRLVWYQEQACAYPGLPEALKLFSQVDCIMTDIFKRRGEDELQTIAEALRALTSRDQLDAYMDIFLLAIFCAVRKAAFDEVYAEVKDRNPLFNNQSDQAAAFAESFALGSRCESYFGISPSVFGKLLSDRFRQYYEVHQPPSWINGAPALATSYAGAQIDVDPDDVVKAMPSYQRFTFLSVFAIPALFDIILLTITGRGLYLSAYMSLLEKESATTALMISLILSGAIGTWISCGGSYYLVSMAFSAMNMFVLTRLIAGLGFTIFAGLVGFIGISIAEGPRAGLIFFLYLFALTAYLTFFAAIASFTFPGTSFLSGRKIIIACIPFLFISPIITVFAGNDIVVYLCVLYAFILLLAFGLRRVGSRWVTRFLHLRKTDDTEIKNWYVSNYANSDEKVFANMSDPAAMRISREALYRDVVKETKKSILQKPSSDRLVRELANDWEATNFLINWYCRYSDVQRPIPLSSSWNIQMKVALDTLRNAQKGLRLHNAFIHWRQAGDEVGCGVLYFVVALLDKWVELITGGQLLGLSAALSDSLRMSVGFGLAYYLIGAVLVDTKAQHLHELASQATPTAVKSTSEIRVSQKRDIRAKRRIYWVTLMRFLFWHVWSLALTSSLIWLLQDSLHAVVMFLSYAVAYTGLLWYQYTKIFAGPHAFKPLILAVLLGLPVGVALKVVKPNFLYSGVISLAVATWSAAFMTLWEAKLRMPKKVKSPVELGRTFHAHTAPWSDPEWSQQELQTFYENLESICSEQRYLINSQNHPGDEVKSIIRSYKESSQMNEAFPKLSNMVKWCIEAWEKGHISVELLPKGSIGPGIRALSCSSKGHLKICIEAEREPNQRIDISKNCQLIAETLLHSVAEALLQIPHQYARLCEDLFSDGLSRTTLLHLNGETATPLVIRWARRELLKQLCLGYESNIHWDKLPKDIRSIILLRCLGKSCQLSESQRYWLENRLCRFDTKDLDAHIMRCNLSATAAMNILEYAQCGPSELAKSPEPETQSSIPHLPTPLSLFRRPFSILYHGLGILIKYLIIAMVADSEFQREFDFVMSSQPAVVRVPVVFGLGLVWTLAKLTQNFFLKFFLFHSRDNVKQLWEEAKEMKIKVKHNRVMIQNLSGTYTAFKHDQSDGGFKLFLYRGVHKTEPRGKHLLASVNTYSKEVLLLAKEEYKWEKVINEYQYDYGEPSERKIRLMKKKSPKIPIARRCMRGENAMQSVHYNSKGLIESGSYMKDGNLVRFKYHYRKNTHFGDELLRAEFVLSHITCNVAWCAPPKHHPERIERWIPHSKVTEASFVQGADVYESRWLYDHKFHPTIFTTLNGQKVHPPPLIEHDYLSVLTKPKNTAFIYDNPLYFCTSVDSSRISDWLGLNVQRFPASTSAARSRLWRAWKESNSFDGVVSQWMDERLLRREKVLRPYWRCRDRGDLEGAKLYIDRRADAIMASVDLDDDISSWAPLAIKINDLFNFGPGGDAVAHTRTRDVGFDTAKTLHVLAADNGTWPNEGGGVSACRRDMVNSLRSVKWHMICESAHDFGIPKHQTEQNVQSLKVVPLWGLDFLTPIHGLFKNRRDAEVDNFATAATDLDIQRNFVPTLTALVKGARAVTLSMSDIKQATRALVNLNTYFQDSRHWGQVWTSEVVKEVWRELWLTQKMSNAVPSAQWFETELPTLGHLDTALELWFRYLFIFSIPVPDKIPGVFQASHHSVSASYGIVCKIKRKCTLQIWDHAISWRETNLCLSSALCKLPPFVRNSLLGLLRLTSVLILHHADIILPCADFFNPEWEVEIGTCQGTIEHRNSFKRKVDPVVNGITDMQKFTPVKEIKAERPTVTMLSHVWYAKDIKTALLAADIIINEWGFDDYHLDIYGALDKAPTYSTECQEIIASKGLRGKATLRGTADPIKVLENTWLFLNSSLSEGLPLALGEAALTGAPVVCTDVGASLRVLSDPDDFSRFSAVVAPNDARALARAQINLLALLGEWSKYADDTSPPPVLPSSPTRDDVEKITRRMYEKSEQRRKLGLMTRAIVQKSFSGDRYLREHEQMLWIGKSRKIMHHREEGLTDLSEVAAAVEVIPPVVDEEVITIPCSAVYSWRSTAATGMYDNALVGLAGDTPVAHTPVASNLSINSGTSTEADSTFQLPPPARRSLPVFAPRLSQHSSGISSYLAASNRQSRAMSPYHRYSRGTSSPLGVGGPRGLWREDLRQYRDSDVSLALRDSFLDTRPYSGTSSLRSRIPEAMS